MDKINKKFLMNLRACSSLNEALSHFPLQIHALMYHSNDLVCRENLQIMNRIYTKSLESYLIIYRLTFVDFPQDITIGNST